MGDNSDVSGNVSPPSPLPHAPTGYERGGSSSFHHPHISRQNSTPGTAPQLPPKTREPSASATAVYRAENLQTPPPSNRKSLTTIPSAERVHERLSGSNYN